MTGSTPAIGSILGLAARMSKPDKHAMKGYEQAIKARVLESPDDR